MVEVRGWWGLGARGWRASRGGGGLRVGGSQGVVGSKGWWGSRGGGGQGVVGSRCKGW